MSIVNIDEQKSAVVSNVSPEGWELNPYSGPRVEHTLRLSHRDEVSTDPYSAI